MRINTNTAAMNTYSNLTSANASKSGSLAKLSSGLRINKAGDDAAGLTISEKMKNQISGMTQASRNAQDGISLIQTAEGALSETHSILNRMRDLTVQAGNGTNTLEDKDAIQKEIVSLTEEVERIATDTKFNTQGLLNGKVTATDTVEPAEPTPVDGTSKFDKLSSDDKDKLLVAYKAAAGTGPADSVTTDGLETAMKADKTNAEAALTTFNADTTTKAYADAGATPDLKFDTMFVDDTAAPTAPTAPTETNVAKEFTFQIGANAGEKIKISIADMSSKGLGIKDLNITGEPTKGADGKETSATDSALQTIDAAIKTVSSQRADLGAVQNRLDHTVSNLATTKENLSEANSRITDVDMAEEMMSFTKSNILSQASTSMLAQANQMPQSVLSLLQ